MNAVMAALAYAVLAAFVGILLWKVPSPDLIAVALIMLALVAVDFVRTVRRS